MDYEQIAVELAEGGHIAGFGVMPRKQICIIMENAIAKEGDQCPFVRTEPGVYIARKLANSEHFRASQAAGPKLAFNPTGIITCYGQVWARESVTWRSNPVIFGCQFQNSPKINFFKQVGIYTLHSNDHALVYTGVSGDRTIGECLYEHTSDRLDGRWNRFSFYGLLPINENGTFSPLTRECTIEDITASLQSILVEVSNPPANRRAYDYFSTLEFVQWRDPERDERFDFSTALDNVHFERPSSLI
jgi:hypothetical protein